MIQQLIQVNRADNSSRRDDHDLPRLFVPEEVVHGSSYHSSSIPDFVAHFG